MTPAEPIAVAARPRGRTLLIALATLALSIPLPACSLAGLTAQTAKPAAPARQFYALWITRWDTRSERDVVRAIANAHALGVTDVFWQVRGTFDAFYKSDLEPWGEWLTQSLPEGEREPPFDPLAVAIREAHARNIRIHAWVNATPLWRGKDPPKDPRHPINAHPEWRLRDARGNPDPLRDGYVIANPVLENVHDHIARVCADIARRYDIDGLHLDYIRFDPAVTDRPLTYPRDAATISQFERTQGPHNLDTPAGQAEYRAWIRDRITEIGRAHV